MIVEDFFLAKPPEFTEDPFPFYNALRSLDPIWWSDKGNRWLVTGYNEVSDLLKHEQIIVEPVILDYEKEIPEAQPLRLSQRNWLSKNNEPAHSRMRRPFFEVSAAESLSGLADYCASEAKRLLLDAPGKSSFDALYGYAAPLLTSVIAEWCGIPSAERLSFRREVHLTASHFSPLIPGQVTPVYTAGAKLLEIIEPLFLLRKAEPGNDFISRIAQSKHDDVTTEELIDNILLAIFASYETTLHLIVTSIYQLIQTPNVLAQLQANAECMADILDETLRLFGPVQLVTRRVLQNFEYRGKMFSKDEQVWLILAAANRDPNVFEQPDQMLLNRRNKKHLAFGSGPHYCIGTHMARRQTAIALKAFFESFPKAELAGPCSFHPSTGIRGLLSLPVRSSSSSSSF